MSNPYTCADFNGCYTGSPLGDTCASNVPLAQNCDEKRYRLSKAIGYNAVNGYGYANLSTFKIVFSAIDVGAGLPDKEYLFGSTIGSTLEQEVTFTNEVIGLYFLNNNSPDIEGIFFLTEDGGVSRIGEDQASTHGLADYFMLS